jgi:hypothetical protein
VDAVHSTPYPGPHKRKSRAPSPPAMRNQIAIGTQGPKIAPLLRADSSTVAADVARAQW